MDNAQDEVVNAGGTVDVYYDEVTREVKVVDTGRGMPLEKLAELCEVLHSSGKFSNDSSSAYGFSGGLNGVGNKIANFLSEYYSVKSERDGKFLYRYYEDGIFEISSSQYRDFYRGKNILMNFENRLSERSPTQKVNYYRFY